MRVIIRIMRRVYKVVVIIVRVTVRSVMGGRTLSRVIKDSMRGGVMNAHVKGYTGLKHKEWQGGGS